MDAIWLKTAQELYGKEGEIFTYENSEHLWAYIPHFHSPFYVYGYAFGELLTQSLFAQRQRLGAKFEPLYLDLLRSGATKDVVELLAPFGLDARNEAFWKDGITVSLGALIEEAEQLSRGMGRSEEYSQTPTGKWAIELLWRASDSSRDTQHCPRSLKWQIRF